MDKKLVFAIFLISIGLSLIIILRLEGTLKFWGNDYDVTDADVESLKKRIQQREAQLDHRTKSMPKNNVYTLPDNFSSSDIERIKEQIRKLNEAYVNKEYNITDLTDYAGKSIIYSKLIEWNPLWVCLGENKQKCQKIRFQQMNNAQKEMFGYDEKLYKEYLDYYEVLNPGQRR